MSGLPAITIIGNLVETPSLQFTPNGHAVSAFTVATTDRRRDDSGEWVDRDATFVRVQVWRQLAENVAESFSRGDRVIVIGRLRQRQYETEAGEKRTAYQVDADEVAGSVRWAVVEVRKVRRPRPPEDDPSAGDRTAVTTR